MELFGLVGFGLVLLAMTGATLATALLGALSVKLNLGLEKRQRVHTQAAWAEVAARRGWEQVGGRVEHQRTVTDDGLELVLSNGGAWHLERGPMGSPVFVEARIAGVAPAGTVTRQTSLYAPADHTIWSPLFDRRAVVHVPHDQGPRLGADFQAAFLAACAAGLHPSITDGDVVVRSTGRWITAKRLELLADQAVALARSLSDAPLEDVLVKEILGAGVTTFRLRCLIQLGDRAPERYRAVSAKLLHCGDPDLEREAQVAQRDVSALVRTLHGPPLPHNAGRRAIRAVLDHGSDLDRVDMLRHVAATYRVPFVREELAELAERPMAPWTAAAMIEVLEALGTRPTEERNALAPLCVRVLGTVPATPAVEAVLQGLLERFEEDVVVAAATALRAAGTVASVPLLTARADTEGLFAGPRVQGACRQAICAIQSRASGSVGDLSLAATAPELGALSTAQRAKAGALSEPKT